MNSQHLLFALALLFTAVGCGQVSSDSSATADAAAPIVADQQRLRCSMDGINTFGPGVVIRRNYQGVALGQEVVWTGGDTASQVSDGEVTLTVTSTVWSYNRPGFQLNVISTPFDGNKRHFATLYSTTIAANMICERLY